MRLFAHSNVLFVKTAQGIHFRANARIAVGELLQRPARPAEHLTRHPGSAERVVKPHP